MSSGSLESPNIDLYNPMAWSDVAVDFEMARSCQYTSGSGRTFAIHRAKYVEGCTSLDGLQFLGGDNSLEVGLTISSPTTKRPVLPRRNSLKDLDSSELFSLSLCSIPGHASSGSSWIRSMLSWWRTCTEFGCCMRPGRDGASLHFDFVRNAEGCTSNSYVCHGINERGCTRNDRRNITKSSAQFIDNLDYQQHLCGVLRLFLSVQWWITWLIFVVRITVGVVSRLCFLDYDKSTSLDAGDLGWQSLRLATIGVMTFWIALRSGRVRHKRLVCVGSSRHQRPQKRANGLRLSVIGLCIIVANAHAIDVHQSICSRSPIPTDVAKATWVGSDDSVVDPAYDEFAYDTMMEANKVKTGRELTVSEKRSPWDATPEWPPDFAPSIEELDFSVNTLEFRYERTCSNARSHVTDLWCIVCPSDYACTDEERSISDLRTSVIALNPPMHKQSRLPDSGVTTRSSIDDVIWPLPETLGEAMRQPRRIRLVTAWPNLVELLNEIEASSDRPVRLQTYGIRELFLGIRFTYSQGTGPGEILAATEALWHREINGGHFQVHTIRPQPVDTPRDCVAIIVEIWSPFIDVDILAPVVVDTIHYSPQPRGTDGGFTQLVDYLPRWTSSQNIFNKVSLSGICPSGMYRCVIVTIQRSYQHPDFVNIAPGYYLTVLAIPNEWYTFQTRVATLLSTFTSEATRFTARSDDESVLVRVHGYSSRSASLGRRSFLLTRHLYHDLHVVRSLAIELWRDVFAQGELLLVHAPLPQCLRSSESVNLILGPRLPRHLVPILVSVFTTTSADPGHFLEHGPFATDVPREAPFETFRRSFWNAAGQQVVAAPGRVWCEGRYYDFDDPLPMVAGTHLLVYDASTQSEDNSTYTDWFDDESNGEETEAADDDSSMLQINSDQYQTCVKCSEDLGSPPILQWRPNPQLQQPFDEVVPDVRTGPNGPEIVGTIQPPPNWESTPMFRAAAASGACRRGPDGHLVVHIRSWYVAHNGLCIHQPRDFAMRPQLLVRLTNALRRTWRDHLPGHETITARAVRPSPVDSDATRRFHIIAEINRPVRTDLNPILIAIREITSGGVSVPSWCTALLPTHMGSVDLYQACRPSCRLHQFLIPVGGNLRRWLTPYHARVISPGLFIPCWYDRRLQPVQQPIYETEDDNTELMQRVAVSASSTPQQTPSSTASSSGTVLIHGFRMSAEHRLVVLDPGSQTTYFHQLQEAWKAPKHDQLIDYHLVASPPRDLTDTGDSVFLLEWTTDRNRQAVQSDQLILLDIILTDDDPGAAPHTIRRVVWTRHMMSRQGILHLTSSAAICDRRGTECHLHINHRLWTPDDVMLRQIAHGDYVCLQIRGTPSTTTVELQVELCEQESADSQRYLFQPSPQKSPTTPPEELEGPESEHTNGTDRLERSRSPHRRHDEQNEGISFLQLTATKKLSGRSSWRMRDDLMVVTTSARHWFQLKPWISPRQTNGGLIEPWVYVVITTISQTLFATTCNVSHGWRVCSFDGLTGQRCEHSLDVGDSGLSGCRHDLVRRPTRSQHALLGGSSSKLHSERNVVAALFEQYSCVSTDCGGPVMWLDPLTGLPPPGNGKWTFVDLRWQP